jgi:hypothetical protein
MQLAKERAPTMNSSTRTNLLGRIITLCGVSLAAAPLGLVVLTTPFAPPAAASAPAACATSDLVTWINTNGNGAAGSIYYTLEFTNLSGHPCTMLGYPGVSAISLGGDQVGSAAGRSPGSTPRLITVARGATATAILQITEAGNFPNSSCHRTTAAGLRVYPPNQRASSVIPFPFAACSITGPTILHVEPIQKG